MLTVKSYHFRGVKFIYRIEIICWVKRIGGDMRAALSYVESSLCYGQYNAAHEEVSVERYPETVILKCAAEKKV